MTVLMRVAETSQFVWVERRETSDRRSETRETPDRRSSGETSQ